MKTYKLDAYATEYYKSSNDLIIEIETEHMMYARRFLVKTSSFEAFEAQETLNDIPDYSILGYVHAQIVDENADSLLLNLPHPYTGEDNLFWVKKEVEEEIKVPTLTHDWVNAFSSKLVKDCARILQVPEEILQKPISCFPDLDKDFIDKMLAEQKSRFLSACARTQRKEEKAK